PLADRVLLFNQIPGELVRAGDHGSTGLAGVEKRIAVDFARRGVMNDVAAFDPIVLLPEPGIDPKARQTHDLLLLVAHGSRYIHHVDDDRIGGGLFVFAPRAKPLVVVLRHDDGAGWIVG